jgi:hypothetical protein
MGKFVAVSHWFSFFLFFFPSIDVFSFFINRMMERTLWRTPSGDFAWPLLFSKSGNDLFILFLFCFIFIVGFLHSNQAWQNLFNRLGVEYYTFHDRDIAPMGLTLEETNKNLDELVTLAKELQEKTGVKLLWGTANLFSHPVSTVVNNYLTDTHTLFSFFRQKALHERSGDQSRYPCFRVCSSSSEESNRSHSCAFSHSTSSQICF